MSTAPDRFARDAAAEVHVRFVHAALAFAVLGGFSLAVSLPVEALLAGVSVSWASHAQVHGHLQVAGFAGLFVVGVAARLVPRFGSGRPPHPLALSAAWWCLVLGVVGRAIGQPIATHEVGAQIMVGGALLELLAAGAFAWAVVPILAPAVRAGAPHAVLIAGGACWFLAQAALGVAWLSGLAAEGGRILRADLDALLLAMQLFGFLLGVFMGVGTRSFPTLFGMPVPSRGLGLGAAGLLNAGLAAWVIGALSEAPAAASAGQAAAGGGVLLLVASFGFWRRETRFAAASQPLAWAVRGALVSLALTGALLLGAGAEAALRGEAVGTRMVDGTRHVFGVGVVTLGIVGMAQLILPEFASERLVRRPSARRGPLFAAALVSAMLLRGVVPMLPVEDDVRFGAMAVGGTLAWAAATAFAVLFLRARRAHRAYLERSAAWRAGALPTLD